MNWWWGGAGWNVIQSMCGGMWAPCEYIARLEAVPWKDGRGVLGVE